MTAHPSQSVSNETINQSIAWRAAISGWWWGSMAIVGGILWGVSSDQGQLAIYRPAFWIWCVGMLVFFSFAWRRIYESASLGLLNFTITRLGWMLVATVLWAALSAGPTGAYAEMFKALVNLTSQPEDIQVQVIGALILGQGFVILATLSWIILLLFMFIRRRYPNPNFGAFLMSSVLLFCGLAFAFGAHSVGQLVSMAPRV